jgi:hypothetical protein
VVKLVFLGLSFCLASLIKDGVQLFSMKRNLCLIIVSCLFLSCVLSASVAADVSVGVKQGDWIEYNITFTGNPPVEHDVVWARMEVVNVTGRRVNATFISQLSNESILTVVEDLDFEAGRLIDLFIIPSGLNVGDKFYDQVVGDVTIDAVEVRTYAGASRTVVRAAAVDTQWYWDKSTGVAVEARTSNSVYTLDTIASSTGLWSPQILGLDPNILYAMLIVVTVGVIIIAVVLVVRKKRR